MAETRLKIDAEAEVSTTELAAILGVTARRVQQMAQDGTIIPVRRGYFQLGTHMQMVITSGLAGHGLLPRVNNLPEIVVIDLVPQN